MFSSEAYNVEMGVSNQLFPQERDDSPSCRTFPSTPEDTENFPATTSTTATAGLSDIEPFSNFMRMLAPPVRAPATASTSNGKAQFSSVGRALCPGPAALANAMARAPAIERCRPSYPSAVACDLATRRCH